MRRHAAAGREDACRVEHALEVFGRGLDTHQNGFLTRLGEHLLRIVGEEHHGAGRCARRGGQTFGNDLRRSDGFLVEDGVEQLIELGRFAAQHGGLLVDQTLAQHVHGDLDHRGARALAVAALEHPQLAVLDRELDILHVGKILLQVVLDVVQLFIYLGHDLFERGVFRLALLLADVLCLGPTLRTLDRDLLRGADAGHDVLALGVDEVLAVEDVFARGGVARECHARGGVLPHVAEDHRLHRHGRAPFGGDVVELAVEDRALVHPRTEHGADGTPELIPRIGREVFARLLLHGGLEVLDQLLQVVGRQVGVVLHAALGFLCLDDLFERIMVFFRYGFHAQHHVAVHLHETTVGVPCEARVARAFGHGLDGLVVHAQVEDRVHHAGHRGAGARTHRYQQGHLLVAELHARETLDVLHRLLDLGAQHLDDGLFAVLVIFGAHLRGDGKARRHGDAYQVHFCEVGAFAAQQFAHFAVAFGFLVAERVDPFNVCHKFFVLFYCVVNFSFSMWQMANLAKFFRFSK